MFKAIFLVGCGGFTGSILRFLIARFLENRILSSFPYGTFTVNILGCLIVGFIYGLMIKNLASPEARLFLATGFCGGFTTFSTFSYELFTLMQDGQVFYALLYLAGSLITGFLAVWAGILVTKMI